MIKAVTFDLDGVYFTADSFKFYKSKLASKISDQALIDHVLTKSPEMLSFKSGTITEVEYWQYVNQNLGLDYSVDKFSQLLSESYSVNTVVVDMVKKVRDLGIKTCICSNNFPTRINSLDKKFNFLSGFDIVVLSYEVGAIKPEPKIFLELINKSSVSPSEIFYTDDKEGNITSAQALGIQASQYIDLSHFMSDLHKLGIEI